MDGTPNRGAFPFGYLFLCSLTSTLPRYGARVHAFALKNFNNFTTECWNILLDFVHIILGDTLRFSFALLRKKWKFSFNMNLMNVHIFFRRRALQTLPASWENVNVTYSFGDIATNQIAHYLLYGKSNNSPSSSTPHQKRKKRKKKTREK